MFKLVYLIFYYLYQAPKHKSLVLIRETKYSSTIATTTQNPQQTESERLLGELVDSLSDEGIKNEAEEKGLNPEETKVFVKRKVELRDTLKGYKK